MEQTSIFFNRPNPDELFKPGSQNHSLLTRLLEGPIDNGEMLFKLRIGSHTRRISDLREKLRPYTMDVKCTADEMDRSRRIYRLVG